MKTKNQTAFCYRKTQLNDDLKSCDQIKQHFTFSARVYA